MENRKEFYDRDVHKYNVKKYGMNVKYGKHYTGGKPKVKPYVIKKVKTHRHRRGMNKFEFVILWTVAWFLFMFGLSVVFNTMGPLWLLIFWFIGLFGDL